MKPTRWTEISLWSTFIRGAPAPARSFDHLTGLLGYEVDRIFGRGEYPVTVIARSPYIIGERESYSDMVFYEMPNGAIVFATGSMQWSWGLDDFNGPTPRTARLSTPAHQMTGMLWRFLGDRFPVANFDAHGRPCGHCFFLRWTGFA